MMMNHALHIACRLGEIFVSGTIMTSLLIIFIVVAIASIPLTKRLVFSDYDLDNAPWYVKAMLYPLSYGMWAFMLWPLWAASEWAESFQSKYPPFEFDMTYLKLKGIVIAVCWVVVVSQIFYYSGYRAGRKAPKYG